MIGIGARKIEFISTPLRAVGELDGARDLVERRAVGERDGDFGRRPCRVHAASFHTDTVWVPSATRLSAALSPSWPETGTVPARPCAASAATTPPAVPSLEATTASTSLLLAVRNCSMFFCATAGFQLSV